MDVKANIEADNHNAQQVVIMTQSPVLRPNVRSGSFADIPGPSGRVCSSPWSGQSRFL